MGFILSIFMSGLLLVGAFRLVTRADARSKFAREFTDDPVVAVFTITWVACWMVFFWGIFVPPFGRLPLLGLEVWQVGGIGSLIGSVMWFNLPRLNR